MTTAALPDFAATAAVPATEAMPTQPAAIRHDWTREEIQALFERPFMDLLFTAQSVHRRYFDPNAVQVSTLLSIKTGACPIFPRSFPQAGRLKILRNGFFFCERPCRGAVLRYTSGQCKR